MKNALVILLLVTILLFSATAVLAYNDVTVAGDSTHFSEGNAYPSQIQIAGYDAKNDKLYLNFTLTTTEDMTGVTPTFEYYVSVFDGTSGSEGTVLGTSGSYSTPNSKTGSLGVQSATVTNEELISITAFPAAYRIVITVKQVTTS